VLLRRHPSFIVWYLERCFRLAAMTPDSAGTVKVLQCLARGLVEDAEVHDCLLASDAAAQGGGRADEEDRRRWVGNRRRDWLQVREEEGLAKARLAAGHAGTGAMSSRAKHAVLQGAQAMWHQLCNRVEKPAPASFRCLKTLLSGSGDASISTSVREGGVFYSQRLEQHQRAKGGLILEDAFNALLMAHAACGDLGKAEALFAHHCSGSPGLGVQVSPSQATFNALLYASAVHDDVEAVSKWNIEMSAAECDSEVLQSCIKAGAMFTLKRQIALMHKAAEDMAQLGMITEDYPAHITVPAKSESPFSLPMDAAA
jgi:hypothetical protein